MRTKTRNQPKSDLIAIALAAYRPKPRFFSQQLQSLVDQSHQNWICVITFDSSMREALANPSIKQFKRDKRFIWRQNPRQLGVVRNFERAMALSLAYKPTAIAFCDQDDVWLPNKLQVSLAVLNQKPPMSLVHCDAIVASRTKTYSFSNWADFNRTPDLSAVRHILLHNTVSGAGTLFDAGLGRLAKRSPDPKSVFHDRWVAFSAALSGGVYPIRRKLYIYRQHSGNVFGSIRLRRAKKSGGEKSVMKLRKRRFRIWKTIQHHLGIFNNRKDIASHLGKLDKAGEKYRSRLYLVLQFLRCYIEYRFQGKAGWESKVISRRMIVFGLLGLFSRSTLSNLFGISRQRSAPRHRS
jgi:hypothetical protein